MHWASIVAQTPDISSPKQLAFKAFSSHDYHSLFIPVSAVMGRGTVVTVEHARAAATVYYPFQNHYRVTRTTVMVYLNTGGICSLAWSLPRFVDSSIGLIIGPSATLIPCTAFSVNVFGEDMTLPGRSDVSQGLAEPCRIQLCAVLGSWSVQKIWISLYLSNGGVGYGGGGVHIAQCVQRWTLMVALWWNGW